MHFDSQVPRFRIPNRYYAVVKQYFRMLQKPILYTGLTRAKQSLVLLDPQAFDIGLKTNGQVRMTQLYDLLEAYFGHETQNSTDDNIIAKHKKIHYQQRQFIK